MMNLLENLKRFIRNERGLETSEYAIMTGLIAAGTIAAIVALRTEIIAAFQTLVDIIP